ncbi:ADP-heptose:LPS heptosyltransferase [Butyrivibrio proteoclasticus]|uniref:ADP-heptose:LPS heptosyltransferase n=1 Tax=Butyrivibrio proteoclasticus TaxID=43305 RepID=A0A1I5Y5W6_9FIRM|nr:hypothetical protein [Butyrivibrio proteoclasticus]SFQ39596.1 ADP-heptose:LPS heptosyltransferase [Butyrivibrio proteoclasticus]
MDWEDFIKYIDEKYKVGEQLYNALKEKRPNDTDIIISPMQLGDTVWFSAYAEAYKQKNNCRVLYVVKKSQESIPGKYEAVDMVLGIENVEMEALCLYIVRNELWNSNHIIYGNHPGFIVLKNDGYAISMGIDKYENIEAERCSILGLEGKVMPSMMRKTYKYDAEMQNRYENSVLLLPAANTFKTIDTDFWTRLAKYLKNEKGYKVYTNYNGLDCEMMIPETEPLSSTLDELQRMSKYIDLFIGLRSGICDYLAACGANLAVIYTQDYEVVDGEFKFWSSIQHLGIGEFTEIAYEQENEEKIINRLGDLLSA